jgi:putative ABC transport system ATP-binding protein
MTVTEQNGAAAIKSVDVTRTYLVDHFEVHALRGVSIEIAKGEYVGLMGRSGSGKTTLMNIIGGLDHPSSGTVYLFGDEISQLPDAELTELRRRQLGFVFQSFA